MAAFASTTVPEGVPADTGLTAIAVGYGHVCALRDDATVTCWGDDAYGQLSAPTGVAFAAISAGQHHTCDIRADDGRIQCWGWMNDAAVIIPPEEFVQISSDGAHTCGIRAEDGLVRCFGDLVY